MVYRRLKKYDKALDLLKSALSSDLENFGESHPRVAIRHSNIANVYNNLRDYDKARKLLELALSSDLLNFGENHIKVATRYNNLAHVELNLGNFKVALRLFQKSFHLVRKMLGDNHPHVSPLEKGMERAIRQGAASGDPEMQALLKKLEAGELDI